MSRRNRNSYRQDESGNFVQVRAERKWAFFDTDEVKNAVDKATYKSLLKFGQYVRQSAKQSIRRRKKSAAPGKPPSAHGDALKKGIYYGFVASTKSVVVGPAKIRAGIAPHSLEYGGPTLRTLSKNRTFKPGDSGIYRLSATGRPIWGTLKTEEQAKRSKELYDQWLETRKACVIEPHPYMRPALIQNLHLAPPLFRNTINQEIYK